LIRCTTETPTPHSRATLRMPFPARVQVEIAADGAQLAQERHQVLQ